MNRESKEEYLELKSESGKAYIREDAVDLLKRVDAAIFDCDGVLIDTKGSYDRTISRTVEYVLKGFVPLSFPRDMISNEIIFLFKKSGGFNSDWDICYSILMFIFHNLPEEYKRTLKDCLQAVRLEMPPSERFLLVKDALRKRGGHKISRGEIRRLINELRTFTNYLDESGTLSVDRNLQAGLDSSMVEFHEVMKHALYYPPLFGKSIIPTFYEEIYCGSELTEEIYGSKPNFHKRPGLIENERVIVRPETFEELTLIIGKANFGIASGSRYGPARYILGNLLDYMNPEASVFLDDIEKEEKVLKSAGKMRDEVKQSSMMKPNPFSLFKAADGLEPFEHALYIGDSMEDALVVEKAKEKDQRFAFAGVYAHFSYRYPGLGDAVLQNFLNRKVDAILPSVNELPAVLKAAREY